MNEVLVGSTLKLCLFGRAHVRKIYVHPETGELCCDVKAESGENLHLSMQYARQRLA